MKFSAFIIFISLCVAIARANESTHRYEDGENVLVYANKMGPFNNPLETYAYFELPGCPPASWTHKFPTLGQALVGDELYQMNIAAKFKQTKGLSQLCEFTPTQADAVRWRTMVEEQYWYQLYVDDLPCWASFGKMQQATDTTPGSPNVYTHQKFHIGYNGDRIVFANLSVSNLVQVVPDRAVKFSYEIIFEDMPKIPFEDRFRRYLDNTFFEHRIHWFSIFNSFMLVLFLVGMVLIILSRTLRADYARYAKEREVVDVTSEWADECGWKQLHGDVFRPPPFYPILCALVGTGWQLIATTICLTLLAIWSVMYTIPGGTATYGVLIFVLSSFVGGYISSSLNTEWTAPGGDQKSWMRTLLLVATIVPAPVCLIGFLMNFVAIAYDSAQAIPFEYMLITVFLWILSVVFAVTGTVLARHWGGKANKDVAQRVHQIPRLIPETAWYAHPSTLTITGGILPFATIFIELYFIFTSFWNYKFYYVYGFLLLVTVILLFVTGAVSVVATYLLLNAEDHRWQWTSFAVGGSVSFYVFLYAIYFHIFKTKMTGFFMICYYYGYMGMFCCAIGLMCASVAMSTAGIFVRRIYRNVKIE